MDNIKQIKHLHARAGFGMRFEDLKGSEKLTIRQAVKGLFGAPDAAALSVVHGNPDYMAVIKGDQLARKMFQQQQRQGEKDLNIAWVTQMNTTNAALQEKMTLFWHNHFACRSNSAMFAQQLNNIQRENALGSFKTMLFKIAQAPAMLQFLNNQQNIKGHPNENFAREVMELFTLGRGNYTENDVKEGARAFTGYAFRPATGEFFIRPFGHDDGQ